MQISPYQLSRFQPFSQRFRKVNWDSIKKVDLVLIKRENDIQTLESFLSMLHQGLIKEKEYDELDPDLLSNYMELIQMTLQYQEYVRCYQLNMFQQIDQEEAKKFSLKKSKIKIDKAKESIKIEKETLARYKEKVKHQTVFACYFCTNKAFASLNDLNNHYKRRHENELPKPQDNQTENLLAAQTILLQHQIAQMLTAQTQQNQQLQQLQQTAYFSLIGENDDQSSEEEDNAIEEQNLEFEKKLQQMKKEQINRETQMAQKLKDMEFQFQQQQIMYQQQLQLLQNQQLKLLQSSNQQKQSLNNSFQSKKSRRDGDKQIEKYKDKNGDKNTEKQLSGKFNKKDERIEELEKQLLEFEQINQQRKPIEQLYQYNAGELEDDSESSIKEDSKILQNKQTIEVDENINEELEDDEGQEEIQSEEMTKLLNDQGQQEQDYIENINQAGFLAQEKEFFLILQKKQKNQLKNKISLENRTKFKEFDFEKTMDEYLKEKMKIKDLKNTDEEELKQILFQLKPNFESEIDKLEKQIMERLKQKEQQDENNNVLIDEDQEKKIEDQKEEIYEEPLVENIFSKKGFKQQQPISMEKKQGQENNNIKNEHVQQINYKTSSIQILEEPQIQQYEQQKPPLYANLVIDDQTNQDAEKADKARKMLRESEEQKKLKNQSYEESFDDSIQKKKVIEEPQIQQQKQSLQQQQQQKVQQPIQKKQIQHAVIENKKANQIKESKLPIDSFDEFLEDVDNPNQQEEDDDFY